MQRDSKLQKTDLGEEVLAEYTMAAPPRILLALAACATAAHFEFTNPKISQCAIDGKRSGVPWLTKNDAHYICTDANWDALYDPASSIAYASMNPGDGPIELKCPNASQALKCFIFSSWGQVARGVRCLYTRPQLLAKS